jgi:hypothetical protein
VKLTHQLARDHEVLDGLGRRLVKPTGLGQLGHRRPFAVAFREPPGFFGLEEL